MYPFVCLQALRRAGYPLHSPEANVPDPIAAPPHDQKIHLGRKLRPEDPQLTPICMTKIDPQSPPAITVASSKAFHAYAEAGGHTRCPKCTELDLKRINRGNRLAKIQRVVIPGVTPGTPGAAKLERAAREALRSGRKAPPRLK